MAPPTRLPLLLLVALLSLVLVAGYGHTPLLRRLDQRGELLCRACGASLSSLEHQVDPVSGAAAGGSEPLLRHFVNPNKQPFDVVAVSAAQVKLSGERSSSATFFHGYDWQVAVCPHCGQHVGWVYTAKPSCGVHGPHSHAAEASAPLKSQLQQQRQSEQRNDKQEQERQQQPQQPHQLKPARQAIPAQPAQAAHQSQQPGRAAGAGSSPAEVEEADQGIFTPAWAVASLEGLCLEKDFGGALHQWCYKGSMSVLEKKSGKTLIVLGRSPGQGREALATQPPPQMMLGGKPRSYLPLALDSGDACSQGMTYSTVVQLMCCDSFSEAQYSRDLQHMEAKFLRMEISKLVSRCAHEVIICLPRLCLVDGFKYQGQGRTVDPVLKAMAPGALRREAPLAPPQVEQPEEPQEPAQARQAPQQAPRQALQQAQQAPPQQAQQAPPQQAQQQPSSLLRCHYASFVGLVWSHLLLQGSPEALWTDSLQLHL
jgi:Tfp pilus assembly protein FimV